MIHEFQSIIKTQKAELKSEHSVATMDYRRLEKDKVNLSKIVERYSKQMKEKMDTIEKTNKRVREDQEQVFAAARDAMFARLF